MTGGAPAPCRQALAHQVALPGGDWVVWRTMALRAAGFPVAGGLSLADAECTAAADLALDATGVGPEERDRRAVAYQAAFRAAGTRLFLAVQAIAADDRFREAVAWQNRQVLHSALDPLLREPPVPGTPSQKWRRREEVVAKYWQRYCTKNDSIGFFGPVGWASWHDHGPAASLRLGPGLLAARTVYFEAWAIDALARVLSADPALRPWIAPRRLPAVSLDCAVAHRPHGPPVRLSPAEAAVLRACDGRRLPGDIAVELLWTATPGARSQADVVLVLEALLRRGLLAWALDVPLGSHPERHLRRLLHRVGDQALRIRALEPLERLERARAAAARAAGDSVAVDRALGELEATFHAVTGGAPTRAPGQTYAGRTLVYEDCRRGVELRLGRELLDALGPPLSLLLTSARWLTHEVAWAYRSAFEAIYDDLVRRGGSATVPFGELSFLAHAPLFGSGPRPVDSPAGELQRRWAEVLALPAGARRVTTTTEELRPRVAAAFAAPGPGWPSARWHSPDVLIAAGSLDALLRGDFQLVLGELHVALNSLESRVFVTQHPSPAALLDHVERDLPGRRLLPVFPKSWPGVTSRTYPPPALLSDRYHYLALGPDPVGVEDGRVLPAAGLVVERDAAGLGVRTRDGRLRFDIVEVFAELLTLVTVNRFQLLPPLPHTPRVTVDKLVVAREAWRFAPDGLAFAAERDPARRFAAARAWARANRLPRFVFARVAPTEEKPYFVDLRSPVLVTVLAAAIRRAAGQAPNEALVTITEMLPTPEQAWLPDAEGCRYTSELRMVAVDRDAEQR